MKRHRRLALKSGYRLLRRLKSELFKHALSSLWTMDAGWKVAAEIERVKK
jgi:hypothetical protein